MVPIVLLPDTMNYVPMAAILNLLKIDFFIFAKFSDTIWPIDMGLLIIKLYGQYSASHVIPPPPSRWSPGLKKIHFLRFHLITGFKVEKFIWTCIYECYMDRILRFMYFWSPPPVFSPGVTKINFPAFAR